VYAAQVLASQLLPSDTTLPPIGDHMPFMAIVHIGVLGVPTLMASTAIVHIGVPTPTASTATVHIGAPTLTASMATVHTGHIGDIATMVFMVIILFGEVTSAASPRSAANAMGPEKIGSRREMPAVVAGIRPSVKRFSSFARP